MNTIPRTFEASPAVRQGVPLLVGLMGASGSGKTFSALRLATGIQRVTGGDIYVIDTEARRAAHYADDFKFKHVEFKAPFGSLDYLAAIRFCVKEGAKCIVIDSMSHEHEGEGGYLSFQAAEIDRMAGPTDYAKRERVKMAAWIRPSAHRRQMINGMMQLNANFIFCFRAKEKTKPKQGGGIEELGFMPIAGDELVFEQTINMLLLPKSGGVPHWRSDHMGEKMMMKLPRQFEQLFAEPRPLDEAHGEALAQWARGGKSLGGAARVSDNGAAPKPAGSPPPPPAAPKTPAAWAAESAGNIKRCKTMAELNAWLKENEKKLDQLVRKEPGLANKLQDIINERTDALNVLAAG